jgi:hypothetical protein
VRVLRPIKNTGGANGAARSNKQIVLINNSRNFAKYQNICPLFLLTMLIPNHFESELSLAIDRVDMVLGGAK